MIPIRLAASALVVVDVQQGFSELCPLELPIPGALAIVPQVNRLLELNWARIDATQDWHPPDHRSFLGQPDGIYPPHCVQDTAGSAFLPDLLTQRFHVIWRKGYQRDLEAYAVTAQHPGMFSLYRSQGIENVIVCGLATNICCYYTARDFSQKGYRVLLVEDASAGIDIPAAQFFQERVRIEGTALGIEYRQSAELYDNLE